MKSFKEFLSKPCTRVRSIEDINAQFDYEDKHGGGDSREWELISCGQDGTSSGYNELERFFREKFSERTKLLCSEERILNAICECCHEIPNQQRTHDAFKACVGQKLGIKID